MNLHKNLDGEWFNLDRLDMFNVIEQSKGWVVMGYIHVPNGVPIPIKIEKYFASREYAQIMLDEIMNKHCNLMKNKRQRKQ